MKDTLSKLDAVVEWMRDNGVQSFSDGTISLSLSQAPAKLKQQQLVTIDQPSMSARGVFEDVDGAGVCPCGHSWVEHETSGCLHGCSHEVCISNSGPDAGVL
jgi:hypothetical protein